MTVEQLIDALKQMSQKSDVLLKIPSVPSLVPLSKVESERWRTFEQFPDGSHKQIAESTVVVLSF